MIHKKLNIYISCGHFSPVFSIFLSTLYNLYQLPKFHGALNHKTDEPKHQTDVHLARGKKISWLHKNTTETKIYQTFLDLNYHQ